MKTKEAIKFIGNVLIVADMKEYDFDDSPGIVDRLQNLNIEDNFKKVIELLQRGEEFEEMWKEFKNVHDYLTMRDGIGEYEQKYFPKEE